MKDVQQLLAQSDTSTGTQQIQVQIIDQLAALIDQAQQQQSNSNGSNSQKTGQGGGSQGGNSPAQSVSRPGRESTDRLGKADPKQATDEDMKQMMAQFWGHLPARIREQMQSTAAVEFLPAYQELIEEYYKRLAESRRDLQ
jgi:hypothetical protein